ncbi:MAG: autotransporter outer membrane beta-barrel domain-containing protein [Brumimicrobium sp.]|nr:autotransporter outer membrane beta-barrel domain-containing protein [Brumimicrobium sp.]
MKAHFIYIILTSLLLLPVSTFAQDLENIKNEKPFEIHGTVGAGTTVFTSNSPYQYRDPFAWNAYAGLTMKIYGIELPFSFSISQFSKSYSQPFTQFGLSPTYKWVTLHLGYRSMTFSRLIFDGQNFLGGGIELKPKWFRFGAFVGRLNKAINEDISLDHHVQPQYSRLGYGVKIGFEEKFGSININYFHAQDKTSSIKEIKDTLNRIFPQENTALGMNWSFRIIKVISFKGDFAFSVLNRNVFYNPLGTVNEYEIPKFLTAFQKVNATTVLGYAGNASLGVNLKWFGLTFGYRRIQPEYMSLGTPYRVTDIEAFSVIGNTSFFKRKVSLNASFNGQHNNLNKVLLSSIHSKVGNLNIQINANNHWNIAMGTNFAHVIQKDGLVKLSDSIRMNQLMVAAMIAPSYNITSGTLQHSVSSSVGYTNLFDYNPATSNDVQGDNINASANYGIQFLRKYFGLNVGLSYNVYGQKAYRYNSIGTTIGASTQLLKTHTLSLGGNFGYFFNKSNGVKAGNNFMFSINSGYSVKKHTFGLYASYLISPPVLLNPMDKIDIVPHYVNTTNFSAGVNYSFSF